MCSRPTTQNQVNVFTLDNLGAKTNEHTDLDYDSDFINSLLAIDTSNFDYFVTTNQQQYGLSQTPQVMQNDFSPPSLPAKAIRTANTPFTTHGEDDTFSGFDPVVYPSIDNTSITQHQETTTATTETAPTVSTTPSPFLQPATSNQTKVTRNSRHSEIEQYFCRYPTCKRSQPGSGFKRKDHLDQHLRGVHKETTVSRIRAYPAVKSRSEASSHDATAGKKRKRESDEEIELARIKEELAEERKLRMVVEAENKVLRQKLEIIRGVIKGDGEEWNRNIYD